MNKSFPALRGIAILLVVINHTISLGNAAAERAGYHLPIGIERLLWAGLEQIGLMAVPIFLFLSGCFFVYAARGQEVRLSYKAVWGSLKNVLYPYVIWSLVFYVAVYFLDGVHLTPLEYGKQLLVGYPYNFVPLLTFYYLAAPVLVKLAKRYPLALLLVILAYQTFLLATIEPGTLGVNLPAWTYALTPPILRKTLAIWGIYFPLGVVYSLHANEMLPALKRLRWALLGGGSLLYILAVASWASVISFPLAGHLSPLVLAFAIPLVQREMIPDVRRLEKVGKRAYGLFLTHLVVLDASIFLVSEVAPGLFAFRWVVFPVLFALGLGLPMLLMSRTERLQKQGAYRYVFG